MFGDVFQNSAPVYHNPELRNDTDIEGQVACPGTSASSVVRWEPITTLTGADNTEDPYVYDPWTKACYKPGGRIKWWCYKPENIHWHAAIYYTIGSFLFVVASACCMFQVVRNVPWEDRVLYVYPYAVGSVMFTIGSTLLVVGSWRNHPDRVHANYAATDAEEDVTSDRLPLVNKSMTNFRPIMEVNRESGSTSATMGNGNGDDDDDEFTPLQPNSAGVGNKRWRSSSVGDISAALLSTPIRDPDHLNQSIQSHYLKNENFYTSSPWFKLHWKLDLAGAVIILAGAILYNVSCGSALFKSFTGYLPAIAEDEETRSLWLETYANDIGGLCFTFGSWAFWWAAHGTPSPIVRRPFTVTWWLTLLNLVGSIGFYTGAAFGEKLTTLFQTVLVPNWVELFTGYVLGSLFFLIGSYLMIIEIATADH